MNKDITPLNDKRQAHGYWEVYSTGYTYLWYKGFFHNGKEVGYGEIFNYFNGKLNRKEYYV